MPSSIDVRITAQVTDLQAKFAVARAESQAFTRELNQLARQAASGSGGPELKGQLLQAAEAASKAQGSVKALGAELKGATGGSQLFAGAMNYLKGAIAPVIAAVSAGAILEFGRSLVESAAHIEHEAQVLDLSTTALQDFTESAKLAGVETDVVEIAIRKFGVAQGAALEGSQAQARAFRELGVSASLPGDVAIPMVARALLAMNEPARRARIETELFGRAGRELTPALTEWAKGTDALNASLSEQGLILDPGTTKAAHEADIQLTKAFDKFKISWTPAAVDLAKGLAFVADNFHYVADAALLTAGIIPPDLFGGGKTPSVPPPKTNNKPDPNAEYKAEIAGLDALDPKLRERADLEERLTAAKKALTDATAAHNAEDEKAAGTAVKDIQKELDSLNKVKNTSGFANAGAQAIADAREKVEAQVATERDGALERAQIEAKAWKSVLDTAKLNAAQRLDVQKNLDTALAAVDREKAAQASETAQTEITLAREAYDQKKQLLDAEVAEHRISKQEEAQELIAALKDIEAQEIAAVDDKAKLYQNDALNYQKAQDEKRIITARTQAQIDQIVADSTRAQARSEFDLASEIEGAEGSLVRDVFTKRHGLGLDLMQIGFKIAQDWIASEAKQLTQHLFFEGQKTAITASGATTRAGIEVVGAQTGFLSHIGTWLASWFGFEAAKTAATTTGVTARSTVEEAAAVAAKALQSASNVSSVIGDAAVAAAGAYAATAMIPYVGPFIAPGIAASTEAEVLSLVPQASLAVGAWEIPHEMTARLHPGESVVPKTFADGLRSGGGKFGAETHVHFTSNVHNPKDVPAMQQIRSAGREFVQLINELIRNGSLKPA